MPGAIYLFSNDLRLADNEAIMNAAAHAAANKQSLTFIHCLDPQALKAKNYNRKYLGLIGYRFLLESLDDLEGQLAAQGQQLLRFFASAGAVLSRLHEQYNVKSVFVSAQAGLNERKTLAKLKQRYPGLQINEYHTHTLFKPVNLPFPLPQLPSSFSKFRRIVEPLRSRICTPTPTPTDLGQAAPQLTAIDWMGNYPVAPTPSPNEAQAWIRGGEQAAKKHLALYFRSDAANKYKQTRNALDDFDSSTKLSPWLANGSLSARQALFALTQFEHEHGANESTYWIFFELLWREYFQWYAHTHNEKMFAFIGLNSHAPLTSFYDTRFQSWCHGNTPYPIVNACMNQLNKTGYISNRARQIAASCFVNELGLDWRYGAAYFQEKLVDYDVASNWGNWQYIAGVGADTKGGRHFNLEKQTQIYDPESAYIQKWAGQITNPTPLDSIDPVGWPIDART